MRKKIPARRTQPDHVREVNPETWEPRELSACSWKNKGNK